MPCDTFLSAEGAGNNSQIKRGINHDAKLYNLKRNLPIPYLDGFSAEIYFFVFNCVIPGSTRKGSLGT